MSARANHATAAARRASGFTLLEVMAAMSIFLVGVVSVLALLTTGTRLHQDSQSTALAADAAEEILLLAEREVARADAGADGVPAAMTSAVAVPGRPALSYQWQVIAAPGGSLFRLRVAVSWMDGGKKRVQHLERVLPRLRSARVDAAKMVGEG